MWVASMKIGMLSFPSLTLKCGTRGEVSLAFFGPIFLLEQTGDTTLYLMHR